MKINCKYFLEQKQKKGKTKLTCTVAAKIKIEGDQYRPKDLKNPTNLEESEDLLLCIVGEHPKQIKVTDCPIRKYYEDYKLHKKMNLGNYLKRLGY